MQFADNRVGNGGIAASAVIGSPGNRDNSWPSGSQDQQLLEDAAIELVEQMRGLRSRRAWTRWRREHDATLTALFKLLPSCAAKQALTKVGLATSHRLRPNQRRTTRARG
jgi:hypothetical protein